MSAFVGSVQSQVLPEGTVADVRQLQQHFTSFIVANRRATLLARAVTLGLAAIGLAFIASRVDQPLLIGLCGLVVIAPLVWIGTAIAVPMALVARGKLGMSAGLSIQSGAEIAIDEAGVGWGAAKVSWASVLSVAEEGDRVHLRGYERGQRLLFELVLDASNFGSSEARATVVRQLEVWRTRGATTDS